MNFDTETIKQLTRIADALEKIEEGPAPLTSTDDFELAEAQSMAQQLYEVLTQISTSWIPTTHLPVRAGNLRREMLDVLNTYELYKDNHD